MKNHIYGQAYIIFVEIAGLASGCYINLFADIGSGDSSRYGRVSADRLVTQVFFENSLDGIKRHRLG